MGGDQSARRPNVAGDAAHARRCDLAPRARVACRGAGDRNRRTRTGVRPVSFRRSEREPVDAECVRSRVARAELQAERGEDRAECQLHTPEGPMKRLVVVGNGMAGMACVERILRYQPDFHVTVFDDETHVNYNRVLLSSVLAGERSADDIVLHPREWYAQHGVDLHVGTRIVGVDADARTVTGDDGGVTPYDLALLATGSRAWLPPIEGLHRDGVFVFRTLDDTRALLRRAREGVNAVMIGGGLLGLEAARGLQVQGCNVTVVHLAQTLMERQLDPDGGSYLLGQVAE